MRRFRQTDPADLRGSVWAVFLFLAAGGLAFTLVRLGYPLHPLWALLVLGGVAAIAERQGVAVTDRIEMSASFLPLVFAAVALGPLGGLVAGAVSNATDIRRPFLRWLVYTPVRAITGAASGLSAAIITPHASDFGGYLLASFVATLTSIGVDALFNCLTLTVRKTGNPLGYARAVAPIFALALPLYAPLVGLFVYGYHAYSLWVVVAFFVPAVALQRLIHLYQEEKVATRHLAAANERLKSANLSFATALVATLDARDRYTAGHSQAVAIYARDIAARMGLPEESQSLVHLCGLVHDVGKIGLPAGLLEKPGALTLEERRQMEKHSEIGEQILRKVDDYGEIAEIVRHHHERVDGLGYPDGLQSDEIPLLARIIAVADSYNAMTSDRPYRDALPSRVARLRLAQAVESQFDTSVVAAFEAILASADEMYRMGTSDLFMLGKVTSEPEQHPQVSAVG
jgi:putative nucleotidyltransferase with HDIG domain